MDTSADHRGRQFRICWQATRANLVSFVSDTRKKSADHWPREQFVRAQVALLAEDYLVKMDQRTITAARFREGIENLHHLLETIEPEDPNALNMLCFTLANLVLISGDLVEYYEVSEGLAVTDWQLVSAAYQRRMSLKEHTPRVGKLQHFRIDSMIGVGGFGVVYKAMFGEVPCVLKFVPPSILPSSEQALVDKQVGCMINHPCLVTYYATFVNRDAFITCMEFIEGMPLIKLVVLSPTGLPPDLVVIIVGQLGLAVQHLHFKGFIHRDVKPDNIMISAGCRIKLIDFDTSKISIGKYSASHMPSFRERTASEFPGAELAGTIPYMPPEVLTNSGLGRATDWWAVGVTTFHLSTGRLPFQGFTEKEILQQAAVPSYSWPRSGGWSSELTQFVADCMNPDPRSRLCSYSYDHFQDHPYFARVDFRGLETERVLYNFPLFFTLMQRAPERHYSPPSIGAHLRRARLFSNNMSFLDVLYQQNCYCYSSVGFQSCLNLIDRGYTPTLAHLKRPQEFLDPYDDYSASYIFQNLTKGDPEAQPHCWSPPAVDQETTSQKSRKRTY